jgi:transposase InsO family protein
MAEVCRRFGISRKTGYKWLERFKDQGRIGLDDLSRRPLSSPLATAPEVVVEIVRVRQAHQTWGPKKLRAVLLRYFQEDKVPAESTIARILARCGLIEEAPRKAKKVRRSGRNCVTPEGPNDLWTFDYKGWWRIARGSRCEPLTIRDEWTKFVLEIRATPNTDTESVREVCEELFCTNGLPAAIRSDNGGPFASTQSLGGLTRLSAWWKALGIALDPIDPGHPEQNGSHERLHRDIRAELQTLVVKNMKRQQEAFDAWKQEFNYERPHEALGMRTPGELYSRSARRFTGKKPEIVYPPAFEVRMVKKDGYVEFRRRKRFLSNSLVGWPVGLEHCKGGVVRVWFTDLCLGTTDSQFRIPIVPLVRT